MTSSKRFFAYFVRIVIVLVILVSVAFLLRYPILRGLGNYLIKIDDPVKVEAMFVLAGNPYDRALEAEKLYDKGLANQIICTGGMVPFDFKAIGIKYKECEVTAIHLRQLGVDSSIVKTVPKGTSTKEESEIILEYCQTRGLDSVMVVSSMFHTRRIHYFFDDQFENAGIYLNIHGAPSTLYDESKWWMDEYGLLNVNNEYVKLIYYMIN